MRFLYEDDIRAVDVDGVMWMSDRFAIWRDTGWPYIDEPGRWNLNDDLTFGAERVGDLPDKTARAVAAIVAGLHDNDGWDPVHTSLWGPVRGGVGTVCWWWRDVPVLIDARLVCGIVSGYGWSRRDPYGPIRVCRADGEVVGAVMPQTPVLAGDLPPVPGWVLALPTDGDPTGGNEDECAEKYCDAAPTLGMTWRIDGFRYEIYVCADHFTPALHTESRPEPSGDPDGSDSEDGDE